MLLEDGREIRCTPDHRFLVQDGSFVEAKDLLKSKQRVAVSCDFPRSPPISAKDAEWSLSLGEFGTLDVGANLQKAMAFARLCGYILTDGTVSSRSGKTQVISCEVGTEIGKSFLLDDIELLTDVRPKTAAHRYTISIPTKFSTAICATDMLAFEPGPRIGRPYRLPEWVTHPDCPRIIVCEFLAGMFGGDGHTTNLGKKTKGSSSSRFNNVGLYASKVPGQEVSLRAGFQQIIDLLKSIGVEAHISSSRKAKNGNIMLLLECDGPEETVKFAERVGFRYDAHKMMRLAVAATYYRKRAACGAFYKDVIATANRIREESECTWKRAKNDALAEVLSRRVQVGSDTQCIPNRVALMSKAALTSKRGHGMGPGNNIETWLSSVGALRLMCNEKSDKDVEDVEEENESKRLFDATFGRQR